MKLEFATLDVFTKTKYAGNPLAIVRIPEAVKDELTEEQKQGIATEFNLSETVFLHEQTDRSKPVLYDIFGARTRIPFAGHPTIGTAIYASHFAAADFLGVTTLTTPLVGDVPISFDGDTGVASVVVPHDLRQHQKRLPHPMSDSETNGSDKNDVPLMSIVKGMSFFLVPVKDLYALEAAGKVGSIVPPGQTYQGLHLDEGSGWDIGVTNTMYYADLTGPPEERMHGETGDWVLRTRVIGRIEDPGTGSASSALCCWLALGLPEGLGRGPFKFHLVQGVEMGRRCDIYVTVTRKNDGRNVEKVELSGTAVKVMEGTLEV